LSGDGLLFEAASPIDLELVLELAAIITVFEWNCVNLFDV